jgi:amino acid permease
MYLSFVVGFECFTNSNYVQNFENASQLTLTGVGVTFPTIVFSYSCHPNVLDVFHELKRSNIRRMSKVLYRAMGVACCVFMLVGSFGYITFVDDMSALNGPQNILMSFKYKNWPTVTIVAVLCIGVSIILAMPLSIKPSKDSLRELLFTKYVKPNKDYLLNPEPVVKVKESTCLHVTLVTFVVFSQMLCGMFVQKMESVITLMGATAYPMICYIFPCMFFLKLDKNPWYSKEKLFCIFMIVSMSLLGLYCTYSFFANNS